MLRTFVLALLCISAAGEPDAPACSAGGCADDEVGLLQTTGKNEQVGEHKLCMTPDTPEQAAKRASLKAQKAAVAKHEELLEIADKVAKAAKDQARANQKDAIKRAEAEKAAALKAAEEEHIEATQRAEATAATDEMKAMAFVEAKRKKREAQAIQMTKNEMDAVTLKHKNMVDLAEKASQKSQVEGGVSAEVTRSKLENAALVETKQSYISAAQKHTSLLKQAQEDANAAEAAAKQDKINFMNIAKVKAEERKEELLKIAEKRFAEASAMAEANSRAALATADVQREKAIAESSATAKTEEMKKWVEEMENQMNAVSADTTCSESPKKEAE